MIRLSFHTKTLARVCVSRGLRELPRSLGLYARARRRVTRFPPRGRAGGERQSRSVEKKQNGNVSKCG